MSDTIDMGWFDLPLAALLWLGLALLLACVVLAGVLGATVGERRVKESIARADEPAPDPAAKVAESFTRAGWIEYAPGFWVKAPEMSPAAIDAVARKTTAAELDDFLADLQGFGGAS